MTNEEVKKHLQNFYDFLQTNLEVIEKKLGDNSKIIHTLRNIKTQTLDLIINWDDSKSIDENLANFTGRAGTALFLTFLVRNPYAVLAILIADSYTIELIDKTGNITEKGYVFLKDEIGNILDNSLLINNLFKSKPSNEAMENLFTNFTELRGKTLIRRAIYGDPLVVDLDGDGIETIGLDSSKAMFDLDGDGFREKTGWVSKDDEIPAVDRNYNKFPAVMN